MALHCNDLLGGVFCVDGAQVTFRPQFAEYTCSFRGIDLGFSYINLEKYFFL
jgi:hypothetical protein